MIYSVPNPPSPCKILEFDPEKCTGCNICVETCPLDVMLPNPEKGREPLVLYTEECWACGGCAEECPNDALTLIAPTKQRISAIWIRKSTGEEFRVGMAKVPEPNTRPPLGNRR